MKTLCSDSGKTFFKNIEDARSALFIIRQSVTHRGIDGKRIKHRCRKARQRRVYHCSFCEGYHLTSWRWWPFGNEKYVLDQTKKNVPHYSI